MSQLRRFRLAIIATFAILATLLTGTAASASAGDTTPPGKSFLNYAQGYQCLMVILGTSRVTDNVTPQSQLRYAAYDDGVPIGNLTDQGQESGVWGVLHVTHAGSNSVSIRVFDAAGNFSVSNAQLVTGYYSTGCTPGHL